MSEPPPQRITFLCKVSQEQSKRNYLSYRGDPAEDTLADLRKKAGAKVIDDGDRFEDPEDAKAVLELDIEAVFTIEEVRGKDNPKPITVWTEAYIKAKKVPEPGPRGSNLIRLNVKRKPKPTGITGTDKVYQIKQIELDSMKLDALRTALLAKGYIEPDDQFVDQGVPIKKEEESSLKVSDILIRQDQAYSVDVYSKKAADEILKDKVWEEYKPQLKASDFKVDLSKPELEDYKPAPNHTENKGGGFPSTTVPIKKDKARTFSQLNQAEQESLLKACRLYPMRGAKATCAALRMDNQIEFCGTNIICCKEIELLESNIAREDTVRVSYSEELSKWQSYLVEATKLGASVPLTFGLEGGGGHEQTDQRFSKGVTVHLSKVLALPKAEVKVVDVQVSQMFVDLVAGAVRNNSGHELMRVLNDYGHFVARHFVIGGKVVCTSSTVLKENWRKRAVGWNFNAQAQAAFEAQGVPVELAAGGGVKSGEIDEELKIDQKFELTVRTFGGFGEGSSSQMDKLGDNWLITVATQPQTWRVIGFKDDEIKPTLDYLEAGLRDRAKQILRKYFESQLVRKKSEAVGGRGGNDWDEGALAKFGNKVAACNMMYDQNIDSIQFEYAERGTTKQLPPGNWHGNSRQTRHDFKLDSDDEIVGVEVGWDVSLDHVLIHTKSGTNEGDVMGRSKGAKNTHTFYEPRIRGFHGREGHFPTALGVYYYDLSNDLKGIHRSALLSLERYLFP